MNIVLIGFKNCGKTTVGRSIAEKTNSLFIDTDQLIEQQYHANTNDTLTVREIYQNKGARYFRALEKNIIAELNIDNSIIASGGGSLLEAENITYFKKIGKLIYLNASAETLLNRLQSAPMPAFLDEKQPEQHFIDLYKARSTLYQKVADVQLSTENKSQEAIAEEIISLMRYS